MSKLASDIAAQVAQMTGSVVQVPSKPSATARGATFEPELPARHKSAKPRFTVIMSKEQHRFIMQFALDADSDASTVTRSLFSLLQKDPALIRRLRQELAEQGEQW